MSTGHTVEDTTSLRAAWYARAREQTLETLPAFLKELSEHGHDYNTICYAVAAAAVGAAWAIERCPSGGITGFQAGAIMWEFMEAWNHITAPAWLRKGEDMLYPQYEENFTTIKPETWVWIQEEAEKKLSKEDLGSVHPNVVAHWRSIRAGKVPFGFRVRE